MYQIAGHTMGTPEYTVLEALQLFHDIGLNGAEIVVQDDYRSGIPTQCSKEQLDEIKDKAEQLNLRIIALTPYNSRFNDLDETVRRKEEEELSRCIEYASYLRAEYIRIYGGNFAAGDTDPDGKKWKNLVASMRKLGDEAQKHNVKLVIENHFNTMTVSAKDSIALSRKIHHPAVGILYDQANLTFTGQEDYQTAIRLQMEKVYYMHVKDLRFKENNTGFVSSDVSHPKEEERNVVTRIVGEGELDWPGILNMVRENGYDGWLSLEYERRWHPNDIPDASIGMKQSAEYLRSIW
ncbi:MAG: sugar phosphate isomerase/epimerase [Clostridiales bacterium]|nr:sugar phosphate isomerase/epimerase [Clostridiales bacterium]